MLRFAGRSAPMANPPALGFNTKIGAHQWPSSLTLNNQPWLNTAVNSILENKILVLQTQLNRINKDSKQSSNKLLSGLICYLLLALAIYIFIISPEKEKSIKSSHFEIIKKGMLLGFIIYGVYNSTNRATINEHRTYESIVDTLWGSILIGLVSYISILLIK